MRIHGWMAILVLLSAIWAGLSWLHILILLFSILFVWILEMVNSAIEATVDLASPEIHPFAKKAKDISAGAVLLGSFFSVLIAFTFLAQPILVKIASFHQWLSDYVAEGEGYFISFLWFLLLLFALLLFRFRKWSTPDELPHILFDFAFISFFIWGRSDFLKAAGFFLPMIVNIFTSRGISFLYRWFLWFFTFTLLLFLWTIFD